MKTKSILIFLAAIALMFLLNSCCGYVTSENVYDKSWDDIFTVLAVASAIGIGALFQGMPRLFLFCAFIVFLG